MGEEFINLTDQAEQAGLKLDIAVSGDGSEVKHSVSGAVHAEFHSVRDVSHWLEGSRRGRTASGKQPSGNRGAGQAGHVRE